MYKTTDWHGSRRQVKYIVVGERTKTKKDFENVSNDDKVGYTGPCFTTAGWMAIDDGHRRAAHDRSTVLQITI